MSNAPVPLGMRIINCCDHDVVLRVKGQLVTFAMYLHGPARVTTTTAQVGKMDLAALGVAMQVPIYKVQYGPVQNLPDQQQRVWLMVNKEVGAALPNRDDLLIVRGSPTTSFEVVGNYSYALNSEYTYVHSADHEWDEYTEIYEADGRLKERR